MTKRELMLKVLEPYILVNKTKSQIYSLLGKCIGSLWEEALPIISGGKYEFVDAHGYDFSDGTEAKTASVSESLINPNGCTYKGRITNTGTCHEKYKTGDLRVAVYNPIAVRVDYLYIPAKDIPDLSGKAYSGTDPAIDFTYNADYDSYPKLDKYLVSLQEVAA